jgi:hypothetical protein
MRNIKCQLYVFFNIMYINEYRSFNTHLKFNLISNVNKKNHDASKKHCSLHQFEGNISHGSYRKENDFHSLAIIRR